MRGLFITFEGPEGSGKTTQAELVRAKLEAMGLGILRTREPGGTPTGELIRKILQHDAGGDELAPECELLLFEASRAQLVRNVIIPALQSGTSVLCDRFADSTTVYQGIARGFGIALVESINTFAIGEAVPDLTIMLDVAAGRGLERVSERSPHGKQSYDRIEREALSFHEQVRQGYLELAAAEPQRCVVVNTDRECEMVAEDVWNVIQSRIGDKIRKLAASLANKKN